MSIKKDRCSNSGQKKNTYKDLSKYTIRSTRKSRMNAWELLKEWNKHIEKQEEKRNDTV